jgi:PAS domain S-box-containing protein
MAKANGSRRGRHPSEDVPADDEPIANAKPERNIPEHMAEQALVASEAHFRALVEEAPAVIYSERGDQEHTLLYMSPFVETLLGYPVEAFFADPELWMTRIHPDDLERVQASLDRATEMGERFVEEFRLIARDGRIVWVHDTALPLRDAAGNLSGWQGMALDITARKGIEQELWEALDAARAANLATRQFLAMMSHELRTPMQAILGYAELLYASGAGTLSAEQMEDVQSIQQSAWRIVSLVDQMLDLSRMQSGQLELTIQTVDLAPIVEQVRQDITPQAASKALRLITDLPPSLPPVSADAGRLHQILLNLVGNAVKFTEAGWVRISAAAADQGVDVTISDSGIGIPASALDYIFDEFRQADSSTYRRYGGAGLGLAIARRLAEQQGGSITVTSHPGEGSIFSLRLATAN